MSPTPGLRLLGTSPAHHHRRPGASSTRRPYDCAVAVVGDRTVAAVAGTAVAAAGVAGVAAAAVGAVRTAAAAGNPHTPRNTDTRRETNNPVPVTTSALPVDRRSTRA